MLNSSLNSRNGRVVAYGRTAAVQGHFGSSLAEQEAAIHQYCDAKGFPRPSHNYGDCGAPGDGDSILLGELMESLNPGDAVIVASMDRLTRDAVVLTRIIRTIQQKGAALISVADDFDSRRSSAELMLALLDGGWRGFIRFPERSDEEAGDE